ncbi:nurim homolog [Trichogramma pretiosum]|uniref:nurim homolog n=1 Tax=Trichogramma pretiosum TaxID=7493 RepID=UPI0006C99578|nr:nurim homolog [Trichogramma pretiosum]
MIAKILKLSMGLGSFFYTFTVLCRLMKFLSSPQESKESDEFNAGLISKTLWTLFMNTALLSVFILQHSLMAAKSVKDLYHRLNLDDLERSIYNACSAGALHFVISHWQTITWAYIWDFKALQNDKIWYTTMAFQSFGWLIIYVGCVTMDILDLAGLKQIFYKISGRPRPMSLKSLGFQRYISHMRHPSFIGFISILWFFPLMSIDRLLMASLLTIYMALMWSIDEDDYNYHSMTIWKKQRGYKYY